MSSLGRWSYTNTATIFPHLGTDEFGVPTYGAPYLIACTWQDTGATQTDTNGSEFVPESTYWFEANYPASGYEIYALSDGEAYTTLDGQDYEVATSDGAVSADTIPKRSDIILKFDRRAELEPLRNGGQIIRKVTSYDMSMFSASEIPDWEIFT